jgi:peptidoglycan/xylan/chitin deacetylase (PgdA/CDA1 family)
MIECVFTIDYEIYGNGDGSLRELVVDPTAELIRIFDRFGAKFVCFAEVAEFEQIEKLNADPAIDDVRRQLRELHQNGHEIALHLHPQWCNARYEGGRWQLDDSEYNLCTLPPNRAARIVSGAIEYLRGVLGEPDFTPCSFRAGNWLFQPTANAARVLHEHGLKIDSSVFKGGLQKKHRLDYRASLRNGSFWRFDDDVNVPVANGAMLEIPIYSQQVPFWRMITKKRVGLQKKGFSAGHGSRSRFARLGDFMRFRQPLKFDFCRMTLDELIKITRHAMRENQKNPRSLLPMVAIGHSKDLVDFDTISRFLEFLKNQDVHISTLQQLYPQCYRGDLARDAVRV